MLSEQERTERLDRIQDERLAMVRATLDSHGVHYFTTDEHEKTYVDYDARVNGRSLEMRCVLEVERIDDQVRIELFCRKVPGRPMTPELLDWMNDVTMGVWFVTSGIFESREDSDILLFDAALTLPNSLLGEGTYQVMTNMVLDIQERLATLPGLA